MVRSRRLELPRPFGHSDLNAARLPVPPRPHVHEKMDGFGSRRSWQGRASIKAVRAAQWRFLGPASGQCLTSCLPLVRRRVRSRRDCSSSLCCRSSGRRNARSSKPIPARPDFTGERDCPNPSGRADHGRETARNGNGGGDPGSRFRRRRAQGSHRRISLKPQPFRVRVTVESSPLGGTPISALLKVAVPPGGRLRAGGAIVQE